MPVDAVPPLVLFDALADPPYFRGSTGAVDVDSLDFESPACSAFRVAGIKLLVPLLSQGELIALLSLGPRLSDLNYSRDDRRLLENLAAQAAPAVRVAQLVRQPQSEAQRRAGIEQELRVARLIQQYFLPKAAPEQLGWEVGAPALGLIVVVLLVFPTGRPLFSWTWLVAWLAVTASVLRAVGFALEPGPLRGVPTITNPISRHGAGPMFVLGPDLGTAGLVLSMPRLPSCSPFACAVPGARNASS